MLFVQHFFSFPADQIGKLGVFALAIGWEHLMLLVKYIMQLTISTMPADMQNEMRRKKYNQERKRYMTLRAKKERRSGSLGIAGENIARSRSDSDDKVVAAEKIGNSFQTSPCPPIRESASESYSQLSPENKAGDNPVKQAKKKGETVEVDQTPKRGQVSVRSMKIHSPLQEQHVSSGRRGSRQKLPSRNQNPRSIRKLFESYMPTMPQYEENNHPNFEMATSKHQQQPSSSKRSPLQTRDSSLNEDVAKSKPLFDVKRNGAPSLDADQGYLPRTYAEIGRGNQLEEVLSPSSSISTVPGMPTPCQLNLDSDDDTMYTVEDVTPAAGFYPEATAPPMSPANKGYGDRRTMSSGSAYFDGQSKEATNDDDSSPEAKWGVHHILQYALSEKKMSLSDKKKSR